jgi:protein-disulfide isomerase
MRSSCACCALLVMLGIAACTPSPQPHPVPTVALPVATPSATALSAASSAQPAADPPFELPGVDTRDLNAREHAQWAALVRQLIAPCPSVAVPLAQCVQDGRDCRMCAPAATWVAHAVHTLASDEAIRTAYTARYDPSGIKVLPLDGSPVQGAADAPVTIVVFVDMECPHCRLGQHLIDDVLVAHPGKVREVFKSFPLTHHLHADAAARAAFAAGRQGKFWEMEHALLEGQEHLEARDIEAYARKLRLDMARLRADMSAPDVVARVQQDRQLGDDLKVKGTPTLYVNGRELGEDDLPEDRVREELGGL